MLSLSTFCAPPLPSKRPRPRAFPTTPPFLCTASPHDATPAEKALQHKVETHLLAAEQTPDNIPPRKPTPLPVQLDLYNYHARVASRRRKNRPTADRLYRRCVAINSTDGRAWLGLARLRLAENDIPAARRVFRSAVRASRNNPHLLQAWGVMEERQRNVDRAKELYEAAVRADDGHCASWVALGMWYRRFSSDVAQARLAFERGAAADPGNYYVWHVWGMLEKQCRRLPVARECFRRGVEANPNNAATYVAWGSLEDALGNYEKAVELFNKAHVANPRNTHAYISHAVAAERVGDIQMAVALLETAVAVRPNDPAPRQTLGLVAFRSGDIERARDQFEAALRVDDKHGPTWHAWACVERKLGLVDRARELFQEAIWSAPQSPHVVKTWHSWAMLELEEGDFDSARRYFHHGLEVDQKCVPLLVGLAKLEARVGNMPRARECMEKSIRVQPKSRWTWRQYEELEREFGSPRRAQLVYERCVVISKQVDERLIVSGPLPGDYAAGGMWIDPLDLNPNESAFQSVAKAGNVRPFGKANTKDNDDDKSEDNASMQNKVTVNQSSAGRKPKAGRRSKQKPPSASDPRKAPGKVADVSPKPVFPPNLPFVSSAFSE